MNDELRSEVLRRKYGGQSGRDIARDLHMSRKTVAKVLIEHRQQRANGTPELPKLRERRGSLVDPYEATLRDYLKRYPDMSVVRLLEEVRRRGYAGGYTVLRQRVKQLRKQCHQPPVERFETGPGVQAQMDWATYAIDFTQEGRRKVQLFSYVLGYSRRQYIHFTASQDLETTLREHVRAFEHLQGSAVTCLYDNMKVVVARYEDGEAIYNTRFLAFATHYGFRPVAGRTRSSLVNSCNGLLPVGNVSAKTRAAVSGTSRLTVSLATPASRQSWPKLLSFISTAPSSPAADRTRLALINHRGGQRSTGRGVANMCFCIENDIRTANRFLGVASSTGDSHAF